MDPRRVLTFRAVAHQRSFSRAARALALSQLSVSNQVASLEREIGARLFDRQPGGLRLTSEGEILLEHADAIAERFELAKEQLAAAAEGQRARLRIGAFPTALAGLVPATIARLRLKYPDTKVTVDEGTDDLPARVRSGELHLAVASKTPPARGKNHPAWNAVTYSASNSWSRSHPPPWPSAPKCGSPTSAKTTGPPPCPTD
jgi:DNA-binding transcriptional LysR family regulator